MLPPPPPPPPPSYPVYEDLPDGACFSRTNNRCSQQVSSKKSNRKKKGSKQQQQQQQQQQQHMDEVATLTASASMTVTRSAQVSFRAQNREKRNIVDAMLNSLVVSLIISKLSKYLLFFYFFGGKSFQQHPFIAASPKAESNLRNSGSSPSPSICPPLPPLFPVFTATLFPPRPPPPNPLFRLLPQPQISPVFPAHKMGAEKKERAAAFFFFFFFGKRHNAVHIFFRATVLPAGKKKRGSLISLMFLRTTEASINPLQIKLCLPPHTFLSLPLSHNIHIFISRKKTLLPASQTSG